MEHWLLPICIPARYAKKCITREAHGDSRNSQGNSRAAANIASSCAVMKPGADEGAIPAKLSLNMRATVTAGLAKEVEAVNQ